MKIEEHGLLNLEWLDDRIKLYKSNRDSCCMGSDYENHCLWQDKLSTLEEVKKKLISPMLLCEKIVEATQDIYISSDEFNFEQKIKTFLNSDIKID